MQEDTTPHHKQRLKQVKELKDAQKAREKVGTVFFYRAEKVIQATYDKMGNVKTRYVLNVNKDKDGHEKLKAQLKKFKSHIVQNEELLKDKDYLKGVALKVGLIYV